MLRLIFQLILALIAMFHAPQPTAEAKKPEEEGARAEWVAYQSEAAPEYPAPSKESFWFERQDSVREVKRFKDENVVQLAIQPASEDECVDETPLPKECKRTCDVSKHTPSNAPAQRRHGRSFYFAPASHG